MKNVLIFIVATTIAGASGFALQRYLATDTASVSAPETASPVIGKIRPEFAMMDIEGNVRNIKDWDGQVVLLNFWATWCPPCRKEMPSMQRVWEQAKDENIVMLAVNVGEDEETVFAFLGQAPVEFPLLLDQDSKVTTSWPVKGLPTTYVVDPEGRLAYRAIGGREWDDPGLLDSIRQLHGAATGK